MYNSQETSTRIKKMAKEKGIPILELQELCGLNKNAIAQAGKSQDGMKARNLYSIAELLEVSIDYLLGRTDASNGVYSINGNNNVQVNGHNGDNSPLTVSNALQLDEMERNLIEAFRMLDFPEKIEAISGLIKKAQKKAPSKDGDKE